MFHNKLTKSVGAKRPSSFLPENVRKEFGSSVKKPRLDVRLTQLTPHSPTKSSISSQVSLKEPVAEDPWGEDFCEEAVEEWVLLASQALPQGSATPSGVDLSLRHEDSESTRSYSGVSTTTSNEFKVPKTSSTTKFQNTDVCKQFSSKNCQLTNGSLPKPSSSKTIQEEKKIEFGPVNPEMGVEKLRMEHKALKESFVLKEGEVSILRSQLKQLQLQIETQAVEHRKSLEVQAQKFKKELSEQKTELDKTNSQLQLKIMEATSIESRCKLLESNSKMKLVEPQAFCPSTEKKKIGTVKEKQTSSPSTAKRSKTCATCEKISPKRFLNSGEINASYSSREGPVLGKLVNQFLFQNSSPDISWILYMRKKQSLYKKIKAAEGINSKILALQKNSQTLERSYTAVNQLITLDSACSTAAYPFIISIFHRCYEILCRQMNIVRLMFDVQTDTERIVLNGVIVSCIGKLAGESGNHLMSARPWYEDEGGIESRRALGLLCALCDVSYIAADLICGSSKLKLDSECFKKPMKVKHAACSEGGSSELSRGSLPVEFCAKSHGFLCLLRDLTFSISVQRRSQNFTGVLVGVLKLLCAVAKRSTLTGEGVIVVIDIIREVVFCCPQVEVIVILFELLALLSSYPLVMKSLCKNSEPGAFIDKRHIGLTYFTRDSCVIQVLYRLLPNCETSISLRTRLCCHMVHWLYSVTCFLGEEKPWLSSLIGNSKRSCHCRRSLAQGLVTSMYNTLCDIDEVWSTDNQIKWEIQEALGKAVTLLRVWLQQDKEFWKDIGRDPFGCQLMLSRIRTVLAKLHLNAMQTECVNGLMNVDKEVQQDASITEDDDDEDNYWHSLSSNSKISFFD